MMRLKVMLPSEILVEGPVGKIIAEAATGSFCLLPRHADLIAELVPGILRFFSQEGGEELLAVDEGVLVKYGATVLVSVRNAVGGAPLGQLRQLVDQRFEQLDEQQRKARATMARLEAGFVRQFIQLRDNRHG